MKILIWVPEHIGDFIESLPAVEDLRKNFPNSKLDLIINQENKEIAERLNIFNEINIYKNTLSNRTYSKIVALKNLIFGIFSLIKFSKEVNTKKYDLIFISSTRKVSKIISLFLNGKKIIGTSCSNLKEKQSNRLEKSLKEKGIKIYGKFPKINLNLENKIISEKYTFSKEKNIVVVHALSPLKEKNWPIENYVKIIKKNPNKLFIFIGTKKEQKEIEKICTEKNSMNLCGKLTTLETCALIKKAKLFLGVDSGPMHIAEFLGTPVIALFGFTNEKIWGPEKNDKNKIIKRENIKDIGVEEVLREIC